MQDVTYDPSHTYTGIPINKIIVSFTLNVILFREELLTVRAVQIA